MSRAASLLLAFVILALIFGGATASSESNQSPRVEYTVTIDQPQTQFVGISQIVRSVRGEHVDFRLPTWRPGRYVLMNQAQAIRGFKAFGERGQPLVFDKTDKSTWRVLLDGSNSVRIEYRVYCNSLNDRMRHVDDTHAFLSGAAVFMYTDETRSDAAHVHIVKPEGWKIATGLDALRVPSALFAPNYDALVDSPLEIGVHDVIAFDAAGKPHQIVIWGEADEKPEELKRDFAKIVEEETKIFGSSPYERYLFIIHAGAGASGGTEHVNSTIMQASRAALEESAAYQRFLSLAAHEFFHTWNIKSFRPAGLNPYEYQRENYTDLLWVAEGTTSYYAPLVLVRAGFTQPARYLESLSDSIDAMRNKPGDAVQSVAEASFDSWIHYGTRTPDDVNATVDFYGKGALVSLLIDLEMRRRSDGRANLDQVMRALYERFPLAGAKGYTTDDLQSIIEELSGADFDDVFERNVRAAQPLDLEPAFETVGLELHFRPASDADSRSGSGSDRGGRDGRGGGGGRDSASRDNGDDEPADQPEPDAATTQPATQSTMQAETQAETQAESQPATPRIKAYLGLNLSDGGGVARPSGSASSAATLPPAASGKTTVTSVLSDGPAYAAGLMAGDEILALDGRRLTAASLDARLRDLKPEQTVTITYFRRDRLRTVQITLAGKPDGRWTLRKKRNASDAQKAAYESWLGREW